MRPTGDGRYEIVMGERRWRAHRMLHAEGKLEDPTILAFVRRTTDGETAIDAIIENLARADLTVLEEAQAFARMLERGYSVERLYAMRARYLLSYPQERFQRMLERAAAQAVARRGSRKADRA